MAQKSAYQPFKTFKEFYPFYLGEHANPTCRQLHFIGTTLLLGLLISAIVTQNYSLLWGLPLAGYGFAWWGHFGFEKNRPASFKQPLYSLFGDFVMYWQLLTGKVSFFKQLQRYSR